MSHPHPFVGTQLSWHVTSDSAQLLDEGTSSAMLTNYTGLGTWLLEYQGRGEMYTRPLFLRVCYSPGFNTPYGFPWTEPQGELKHILLFHSFVLVKNAPFHLPRCYGGECFIDNICHSSSSLTSNNSTESCSFRSHTFGHTLFSLAPLSQLSLLSSLI